MKKGSTWIYILVIVVILIILSGTYYYFWPRACCVPKKSNNLTNIQVENWVKNPQVLFSNVTSTDTHKLDDGTFRMYLQNFGKIMYLDSKDATNFGEPISTGIVEQDGKMISNPAVFKIADSNWIMIYEEQPKIEPGQKQGSSGPANQRNLMLATSVDGKIFIAAGVAIDSSKDDEFFASVPDLVKTPEGNIRMYYVSGGEKVGSAISIDGKTWVKEAGQRMGDKAVDPDVLYKDGPSTGLGQGKWVMYFSTLTGNDNRFYKATSSDGLKWTKGAEILKPESLKTAIVDPDLIEISPGNWRMFFGEIIETAVQKEGPGQINLYYADFKGDVFE